MTRLGKITLTLSMIFICIGLPGQIYKTWQTQDVQGLQPFTFLFLAAQSLSYVLYGREKGKRDWVVIIPNAFSVLFATIIVVQYFAFR